MSPNTFRVYTEHGLVKSVGPKVLWVVSAETMSAGGWRIFPSPPVPCLNCAGEDRVNDGQGTKTPELAKERTLSSYTAGLHW
ncbi:hypothetical protein TNCV_4171391 [Trichonephila clavipes]|nr:hypothetical protein TNCV_4171391 [Trichonephila clavipes]